MFYKEIDFDISGLQKQVLNYLHVGRPSFMTYNDYVFLNVEKLKNNVPSLKLLFDSVQTDKKINFFEELNYAGLCVLQPGKILDPHIDCSPSFVSLNIPIIGCAGTFTHYYRGTAVGHKEINQNVSGITVVDAALLESFELNKATWFMPKIPHGVTNPTENVRVSLSLRFMSDPLDIFYKL